jgi:anti-sigma B factor antagonist
MSRYHRADLGIPAGAATDIDPGHDGRGDPCGMPADGGPSPRLRAQVIERTALVRFVDAEILFEEADVRAVGRRLHRLIREEGYTRLVMSFAGVRYISSDVLAILAAVQREVEPARGRVTLCGLDPLLRDMVRITHLDQMFDVCIDEAEALGLIAR